MPDTLPSPQTADCLRQWGGGGGGGGAGLHVAGLQMLVVEQYIGPLAHCFIWEHDFGSVRTPKGFKQHSRAV